MADRGFLNHIWYKLLDEEGRPISNAEVYIYTLNLNLLTIYEADGLTEITQPIVTTSGGVFEFYVQDDIGVPSDSAGNYPWDTEYIISWNDGLGQSGIIEGDALFGRYAQVDETDSSSTRVNKAISNFIGWTIQDHIDFMFGTTQNCGSSSSSSSSESSSSISESSSSSSESSSSSSSLSSSSLSSSSLSSSSLSSSSLSSSSSSSSNSQSVVVGWSPEDSSNTMSFKDNNLTSIANPSGGKTAVVYGDTSFTSGKRYYEVLRVSGSNIQNIIGWGEAGFPLGGGDNLGIPVSPETIGWQMNGTQINIAGGFQFFIVAGTINLGDVIMVAMDADNGEYYWGKNGTWFTTGGGVQNPSAGVNPISDSGLIGKTIYPMMSHEQNCGFTAHFSESDFSYPLPSGFSAIGI